MIEEEGIKNNINIIEEIQKLMENYDIIDDTTFEFFENIRSITDTHVRSLWNKVESGDHIPRID